MVQSYGLGIFNSHVSTSFYRLYQQHQFGGGLQAEYKSANFSNLLHSNYRYSVQTIDEGRRGNAATWAATKNDSRLDGIDWNLTDVFSIEKGAKVHQLTASLQIVSKLGTEFIQRLEKVGDYDLEHWITYGEEQKYYSLSAKAGFDYQLLVKDADNCLKSLLNVGVTYFTFSEKYYLPDYSLEYSNLKLAASYLKLIPMKFADFSGELKFAYQINIEDNRDLPVKNFLADKIFNPELNYLSENYLSPGVSLAGQFPLKKGFDKLFIKADFDWFYAETGLTRAFFSFSTGLIF
jgi:hypothetical protein